MNIDPLDLARLIFGLWFLFLGAAIGSFLNVVIYRVLAGLNIAWPGSHCPKCKHAIRWYDNLPVLGWILLRGKCRDCKAAISIRYPIVEALTASVFLLLAWTELLRYQSAGLVFGPADTARSLSHAIRSMPVALRTYGGTACGNRHCNRRQTNAVEAGYADIIDHYPCRARCLGVACGVAGSAVVAEVVRLPKAEL